MRFSLAFGTAGILLLLSATACGGNKSDVDTPSATASSTTSTSASALSSSTTSAAAATTSNPYGVPSIDPAGPDEPILKVNGGGTPLSLTMSQLNALGDVSITIEEPFVKKRQTFRGVPFAAVLAKAGIPDTATVDTVALNDYHYSSVAGAIAKSQGLIATERDGAPIPYDQGGPVRIVFPDGTPLSQVLDAWNWSLASINVTP